MSVLKLFDGHCDTLSRCLNAGEGIRENSGQLDLTRTGIFAPYAQFFAIYADADAVEGPLWGEFARQHRFFQKQMERNGDLAVPCRTAEEAARAARAGKAAAFLSVEGAELLECSPERLEQAHGLGVRAVNLVWNHQNALSGSNADAPERGLTPLGVRFVERAQALGVLVDVSHLSEPGFWDVAACAQKPFFASHSDAKAVWDHKRNLTDAQFTAIIKCRGVAGLNFYADFLGRDPDVDTVLGHAEHFLALGGERSLSIGGDWDGCDRLPKGISGVVDLEKLWERMLQKNYHESMIEDIFYNNLMRVVSEVCTM